MNKNLLSLLALDHTLKRHHVCVCLCEVGGGSKTFVDQEGGVEAGGGETTGREDVAAEAVDGEPRRSESERQFLLRFLTEEAHDLPQRHEAECCPTKPKTVAVCVVLRGACWHRLDPEADRVPETGAPHGP